ncbi:MAG TPA: sterol desaturase family protein [Kofleriaceae bacterium]|nr:sterol desaturase family protein [Kofleriaceae bacterium]
MNLVLTNLSTVAAILGGMGAIGLVETVIPLHARGRWHRAHLGPNLALTFLTFFSTFFLNAALILLLLWLEKRGFGLLRWLPIGPIAAGIIGILALDFSWYALHRAMHRVPTLWRYHRVHHSDPVVDVTTTIRQHPGESLLRYATLTLFVTVFGIGLVSFAIYRAWSALNGLAEHANVRMPRWLDRTIALVSVSPDMHKVHHSRDVRETDTNYGNIFSVHDRALGTFTPTERGPTVVCGLDGFDDDDVQTTAGLLGLPFRDRVPSGPARASS